MDEDLSPAEVEPVDEGGAEPQAPTGSEEGAMWTTRPWSGRTLYQCRHCSTQRFDLELMQEHVQHAHRTRKE